MSSFVPDSSSSHEERALVPADNSALCVDVIHAVPSSNILPIPPHLTLIPRQLLRDMNWGPRFKHYVHTPRCSINHWLSVEILTYIFLYAIEACDMTSYQIVTVCRRWRNVINGMTHLWSTLRLGTWTDIENVDIWLERSKQGPLTIKIDPQRDAKKPSSSPPYAGLEYAFKSVDRWQNLVIASFPTPEVFGCVVHALTAKPMVHLKFLEVGHRCQDSATFTASRASIPRPCSGFGRGTRATQVVPGQGTRGATRGVGMGYASYPRPTPPGYSDYTEWGTCCT